MSDKGSERMEMLSLGEICKKNKIGDMDIDETQKNIEDDGEKNAEKGMKQFDDLKKFIDEEKNDRVRNEQKSELESEDDLDLDKNEETENNVEITADQEAKKEEKENPNNQEEEKNIDVNPDIGESSILRQRGKKSQIKNSKTNVKFDDKDNEKMKEESNEKHSKETSAKKRTERISEKNKRLIKVILLLTYTSLITFLVTKFFILTKESLENPRKLKYWLTMYNETKESMEDVRRVFNFVGHEEVKDGRDFDVIWSVLYPFQSLKEIISNLAPNQKINHIPGSYVMLVKPSYTLLSSMKFIPNTFNLPDDNKKFKDFVKQNPQKMFLETELKTGLIKLRKSNELRLIKEKSFIQEFIDRPLLVDGRIFDIGFYVVITSVDPLRVYIFDGEAQVRFCMERYHPFNHKNPRKFILHNQYLPVWDVDEVKKYFNASGGGIKASLEANLKSRGFDVSKMWQEVETNIAMFIKAMEPHILYFVSSK
jgi:hypothetical protein